MEPKVEQERLRHIQTIYNEVIALPAPERDAFLDRACSGDKDLRTEIESLVACSQEDTPWLDKPAMEVAAEVLAEEGAGLLVGQTLGRYQLISLVGQGGMGDVYCGVDLRLNRLVAVKILPAYLAADPERFRLFEQEARAIATLNHPHICILHDAGHGNGNHYLVFEYVVGDLLSDLLSRDALPFRQALNYLIQVAEALEHAHQQDIVHRDLKPQNIMITRTGVKVLDFGIAELQAQRTTAPGAVTGTPAYMAPEQAEGHETDVRTDIFSFGRLARAMIPAPDASLQSLIATCLATRPDERWQSISDVLRMLRERTASTVE